MSARYRRPAWAAPGPSSRAGLGSASASVATAVMAWPVVRPGIGIDPGRQVEADHRPPRTAHEPDQPVHLVVRRTRDAVAQHRVHHDVRARQGLVERRVRQVVGRHAAVGAHGDQRRQLIACRGCHAQHRAGQDHAHGRAAVGEVARSDQASPAVVARPDRHHDAPPAEVAVEPRARRAPPGAIRPAPSAAAGVMPKSSTARRSTSSITAAVTSAVTDIGTAGAPAGALRSRDGVPRPVGPRQLWRRCALLIRLAVGSLPAKAHSAFRASARSRTRRATPRT